MRNIKLTIEYDGKDFNGWQKQPHYLTLNESKKILSQTIQNDCKYKIRNYTITCLFLNCGMRLTELIRINLTDIKLDEMTLRLHGKGNKERIIYLNVASYKRSYREIFGG